MEIQDTTNVAEIIEGIRMFLIMLGILFLFTWLFLIWLGDSAFSWPTTKGKILISETLKISRGTESVPRILYGYSINNKTIKSRIIFMGHFLAHTPADNCREITAAYPQNSEVTVYYHPSFPKLSVLEPGTNKGLTTSFVTKLVIIGLCLIATSPEALKFLSSLVNSQCRMVHSSKSIILDLRFFLSLWFRRQNLSGICSEINHKALLS